MDDSITILFFEEKNMSEASMIQMDLRKDLSEQVKYDYRGYLAYIRRGELSRYPDYAALCHWHDDIELIYVLSGKMDYQINGETVGLSVGDGLFVNARQLHFGFSRERNECIFICVLLHPLMLCATEFMAETFVNPVIQNQGMPWLLLKKGVPWQENVNQSIVKLYEASRKETPQLLIQSLFCQIWDALYRGMPEQRTNSIRQSGDQMVIQEMIRFIDRHFAESLSIAQIAAAGHVSPSKCYHLFHDYLHQTPVEYMTRLRLEKSIDLMKETDQSLTEIALSCGFSGASYYSEMFRRYYGCKPSHYRFTANTGNA